MRRLVASIWIALFLIPSFLVGEPAEKSPRLLVHLLDYMALDYPGAVQNKKVVNQLEYDEMKEFSKAVIELATKFPQVQNAAGIAADLKSLQGLVNGKADPKEVAKLATDLKWKIVGVTGIALAPTKWPNLGNGKQLFAQNCTACHGATGHGDGPSGASLDPKPSNFHDAERMEKVTPFQAYNAIRLGVEGTAMASFPQFSDSEVWDLAFYVVSIRHEPKDEAALAALVGTPPTGMDLQQIATQSDEELRQNLPGTEAEKNSALLAWRLKTGAQAGSEDFIGLAKSELAKALSAYRAGSFDEAKTSALSAYLNGVEPIEPRLRASDSSLFVEVEERMTSVRSAIDKRVAEPELATRVENANQTLGKIQKAFETKTSPTVTFTVSAGIVLREAFEAILLLITLLGVIRSVGSKKAALYVHLGWIAAVALGFVFWVFSGWVVDMSGAQREMLEGIISLAAVVVVLYMGFWLHRKTEIGRWREFISTMVNTAVSGKKLFALALVSFMAVFREAFETVLFLRAVLLESGGGHQGALAAGVFSALFLVVILAVALVRFSARIPIRQLFDISSMIMILLAFVLMGKALHSFQETGLVSITEFPLNLRFDLAGVYPTYETLVPQIVILVVSTVFWLSGRGKPSLQQQRA